jgi:arrestin-related trafficking adapter 4/5/7
MLPDAMGCVVKTISHGTARLDAALQAPPPYGRHPLDQLHICEPTVRSQWGMNTPVCSPSTDAATRTSGIRATDLSERLQSLCSHSRPISGLPNAYDRNPPLLSGRSCSGARPDNGYRGSTMPHESNDEASYLIPYPHYYDLDDLSRVPSYSSAIRSRIPANTSPTALPSYDSATRQ